MLMLNATYPFFVEADRKAAHGRGLDPATSSQNVTLAERLAR